MLSNGRANVWRVQKWVSFLGTLIYPGIKDKIMPRNRVGFKYANQVGSSMSSSVIEDIHPLLLFLLTLIRCRLIYLPSLIEEETCPWNTHAGVSIVNRGSTARPMLESSHKSFTHQRLVESTLSLHLFMVLDP